MRLWILLLTLSCGTTGGKLVQLPFRAGGAQAGPVTFTTPQGWTVTLTTAKLALGPFYFNLYAPQTNVFRSGQVIIEATEQVVVDALDPTLHDVPGGADGETGHAVSVEIGLLPPDATQTSDARNELAGKVGIVAGTAVKGAVTVHFSGPIAIDTNLVTPTTPLAALQRVKGAAVDLDVSSSRQTLELRVDPAPWFDLVDFAALPASGTWDVHSTFLNSLVQGVQRETGVYVFALSE